MSVAHTVVVPFVGKEASDLLLWRDVKKTGAVFLLANGAFAYLQFSPLTPAVIVLTAVAYSTLALFLWAQFAAVLSRPGPPVPGILKQGVSEEDIRKVAELVRGPVNQALAQAAVLASGKDMKLSLLVAVTAWIGAWAFKRIPMLVAIYLVVLAAFSLPKGYELKKDEVDKVLKLVQDKIEELLAKFKASVAPLVDKIPKSKKA